MLKYEKISINNIKNEIGSNIFETYIEKMSFFGIEETPTIIGKGMESIIFEYNENMVVVLTQEKSKLNFLATLSNETGVFDIKKIKEKNFPFEECLKNVFLDKDIFSCFFMTKGVVYDLDIIESMFENISSIPRLSDYLAEFTTQEFESVSIHNKNDLNDIKCELERLEESFMKSLFLSEVEASKMRDYIDFSKKVFSSIQMSIKCLNDIDFKDTFILDLHNEQFLMFGEEVICTDPVMFNYIEYI